jgi:uncharacterized membrane protein (Fun14 family)
MKNDLLKVVFLVIGIIARAFILGKALVDAIKIEADGQLAIAKAEQEHKERMADKFIAIHQQAFGRPHCYVLSPDKPKQ